MYDFSLLDYVKIFQTQLKVKNRLKFADNFPIFHDLLYYISFKDHFFNFYKVFDYF